MRAAAIAYLVVGFLTAGVLHTHAKTRPPSSSEIIRQVDRANRDQESFDDLMFRAMIVDNNPSIKYDQIIEEPHAHIGKAKYFSGKILELNQKNGFETALIQTVGKEQKTWLVLSVGQSQFKEGDVVDVVGIIGGMAQYTSRAGPLMRLPGVTAMKFLEFGQIEKIAKTLMRILKERKLIPENMNIR